MATAKQNVTIRLDQATRDRLASLAELMGARAGGPPLPESYALRACMDRGLAVLEAELGAAGAKRKG